MANDTQNGTLLTKQSNKVKGQIAQKNEETIIEQLSKKYLSKIN